ncbi:hypothetical protein JZ751_020567, partial [Albula glossodonta]
EAGGASGGGGPCRHRRPSVAVPTSKARRRSSAGLPSAILTQRRRSSIQTQQGVLLASGGRCPSGEQRLGKVHYSRRRSSTTTPSLNPRFAVRRRRAGRLRTIDTHLLGPSMLLASLIQMTEEEEGGEGPSSGGAQWKGLEGKDGLSGSDSEGEGNSEQTDSDSQSESGHSEPDGWAEAEVDVSDREFEDTSLWWSQDMPRGAAGAAGGSIQSRPLIRAPRCLRRNSSHLLPAEAVYYGKSSYGLYGRYRRTSQRRRRVSTISKAGSPWPGRGVPLPSRRNSVAARRASLSLYRNCSACWRGSLSPLQGTYYDPRLETWSGFLSYVDHYFHQGLSLC